MLIDGDDELAVLHEKAHLQEAHIAAGQLELSIRDNEVCLLGLHYPDPCHKPKATLLAPRHITTWMGICPIGCCKLLCSRWAVGGSNLVSPSTNPIIRVRYHYPP